MVNFLLLLLFLYIFWISSQKHKELFVLAPEEPFSKRNRTSRGTQDFQSWQNPPQHPHSTSEGDRLCSRP